ncbi:MAG: ImmA/IrrE family metallo-endopeptidase [Acidimicrobiia bacterium]
MDVEPGSRLIETQAHEFAGSFLLRRSVALEELPRKLDAAGWTRLAQLKQRWGISMGALLYRARALNLLGQETYRNAMKYMSAKGWRPPNRATARWDRPRRRCSSSGPCARWRCSPGSPLRTSWLQHNFLRDNAGQRRR